MVIEINKDIDHYQESVALGLTAKQLVFSTISVIVGGGIVFLLYPYIGLTLSAYIAIPVVAPIALGGFYSFNGMSFYEVMSKKFYFMLKNKALTYISTEGELTIKAYELEQDEYKNKNIEVKENKEDFEVMKKKMKTTLIICGIGIIASVIAVIIYKNAH